MSTPPTFSSLDFDWHAGKGTSSIERCHIGPVHPDSFNMKSARTGVTRLFVIDREVMEENEFFDGEATAYISGEVRVQIWN